MSTLKITKNFVLELTVECKRIAIMCLLYFVATKHALTIFNNCFVSSFLFTMNLFCHVGTTRPEVAGTLSVGFHNEESWWRVLAIVL